MPEALTLVDPLAALFRPELAGRPSLRLDAVEVEVMLRPPLAQLLVTRRFTNRDTRPIEAALTAPATGPSERVTGLSVRVDGVLYLAHTRPRTQAAQAYGDGLDGGRLAILHERLSDDLQLILVAGIPAGAVVEVAIALVRPLENVAPHRSRLTVALTADPRRVNAGLSEADLLIATPHRHDAWLTVRGDGLNLYLGPSGLPLAPGVATPIPCAAPIRLTVEQQGDGDLDRLPAAPDHAADILSGDQSLVFISPTGEALDRLPLFAKVALPHPAPEIMSAPPPRPEARAPDTRWMILGAGLSAVLLGLGSFHLGPVPMLPALGAFVVFMLLNAVRLLPGDDPAARRRLPWLALLAIPWITSLAFGPFGPLSSQGDAGRQSVPILVQDGALALAVALPLVLLPIMRRVRWLTSVVGLLNLVLLFLLVAISTSILDPAS